MHIGIAPPVCFGINRPGPAPPYPICTITHTTMKAHNEKTLAYGADLRDLIRDEIITQSGTLYAFCHASGFDYSDIHKFLAGEKDWTFDKVIRVLVDLQVDLEFHLAKRKTRSVMFH